MTLPRPYLSAADVAALCAHARPHGEHHWRAACPVHRGDNPTALHISQARDSTLLYCATHPCSLEDICAALQIDPLQLSRPSGTRNPAGPLTPPPRDSLVGWLLESLDADLNILHVPEAQELLRGALADPLQKALLDHKLQSLGYEHPQRVYAAILDGDETLVCAGDLDIVQMSTVTPRTTTWLWYPYISQRTLTMVDGDPGIGKSLFTMALATALSTGAPLPDQQGQLTVPSRGPSRSLFLSREDPIDEVVSPRLHAMGAHMEHIYYLRGQYNTRGAVESFSMDNLPRLVAWMETWHPRLVVIDPIQAYLGAKIDMYRANEVRPLLDNLATVAEEHHCAILCVRHAAKAGGGKAMMRGLGTIDFAARARSVLFVDADPLLPNHGLVAHAKFSHSRRPGLTQIFSKDDATSFAWAGVSRMDAETLAGGGRGPDPFALLEAVRWLERRLESGIPIPAKDLEQQAEDERDIKAMTLRRAKKILQIASHRQGEVWMWRLPSLPPIYIPEHKDSLDVLDRQESLDHVQYNQIHIESKNQGDQTHLKNLEGQEVLDDQVKGSRARESISVPNGHFVTCASCGGDHWQSGVSPPRCLGCGARATPE